jgi:colanic acid biosynthesis protein WcaH
MDAEIAKSEPEPGQWLEPAEFETVVRLTPLVAIDLIVRSPDGRVLVGLRKNEPARHTYFVPGSRISKNESLAAAFRRVSREELGVERGIEEARFLGVYEHFYATNRFEREGFGTHYITLGYELALTSPPASLPEDQHDDYAWKSPSELLRDPNVHENTKAYFRSKTSG